MKMPSKPEANMLAPCGMNCTVCYKHVTKQKTIKPCAGCLQPDENKPLPCRQCKIKNCETEKGYLRCFECADFPCKLIRNLEKSYLKRYNVSLIQNSKQAKALGISKFLEQDCQKWTCPKCGGAFSLHDGICSECGTGLDKTLK